MKSSQLKPSNESAPESASDLGSRPCFATDPRIACLNVRSDDGTSYLLPYAQFLRSETTPNPVLATSRDAPPQKMAIHFTGAEVTLLGSGLSSIERGLQGLDLQFVKSAAPRYAAALKTHVASIIITLTKANV